ncbi:RNA chaperone ProQ [Glaesserella parasuis]|uniref:RNA chaperone ProQ n=1 Tax=Glaesserella parasuis TaxID=738 RepID=UPI00243697D3|nr:RNA chaperone ProQ [Glaesserella parasuis]MDG6273066.1 RNA chaperone ProQ [Glaesserella parasuis]MDG6277258.1 RNA chaperone ProQ [Glaesserella parasuis]MDG6298141.1 RNA chaperone ProQ [Glaesserella parasuis]MDG6319665.1 RNA chaperone ProQ [Glaesserella parasuis]
MSEQQLNTIQNLKTALSTKEIIAYLAEKFPLCFSLEGEAKPLKIGLFQDLVEALSNDEKISKTGLRQALRVYTMSWRYLHACKEGAVRVGLQGEEAGVVEAAQAEHAAQSLAEAKYAERKALQLKEKRKEERKTFFKQKAREAHAKKRAETKKQEMPKASLESLSALESKFAKGKK